MPAGRSLYEVLQVDPRAEPEVLEAAYRRLARKYHPDVSSASGAEQRMKEINAAYGVLRDPSRRAAYDRQLLGQAERPAPPSPHYRPAQHRPAGHRLACRTHPEDVAIGICGSCGAGLCEWCFSCFQPPSCASCLLAWAGQRRRELTLPAVWFLVTLTVAMLVFIRLAFTARAIAPVEVALGYVIASYPSGWRAMRPRDEDDGGQTLMGAFAAALVGPVVAPFRMGRIAWDLRQLGHLEAIARSDDAASSLG